MMHLEEIDTQKIGLYTYRFFRLNDNLKIEWHVHTGYVVVRNNFASYDEMSDALTTALHDRDMVAVIMCKLYNLVYTWSFLKISDLLVDISDMVDETRVGEL